LALLRVVGLLLLPWLLSLGCGYRVGRPPVTLGLCLGEVRAPVAEPGVADAMSAALAAAIRRAGAHGERGILVQVRRADFQPSASRAGSVLAWEAVLEVSFVLSGPQARELTLKRSMVVVTPAGGMQPNQLRSPAFEQLAVVLADEAVSSFLYAPAGADPAQGVEP